MNRPDVTRQILSWLLASLLTIGLFMACNAQCITDVVPFPYGVYTECHEDSLNVTEFYSVDCPNWYNGGSYVYEFYSDGYNPTSIIVDSDLEYTFDLGGSVWAHAFITDECNQTTIWSTSYNCPPNPMVEVILDTSPSTDWMLDIILPEGVYYFHIGNVGVSQVQNNIIGCFDLAIGTAGLLNLGIYKPTPLVSSKKGYLYNTLGQRTNR